MPNTKSAERRMRNSARKKMHNRSIKTRLKSLERVYADAVKSGKKEDAVIHKGKADRKKSRLSARLTTLK
jgi:small subunit ribosomal protein S20